MHDHTVVSKVSGCGHRVVVETGLGLHVHDHTVVQKVSGCGHGVIKLLVEAIRVICMVRTQGHQRSVGVVIE